jgi:hypothetical protein
VAIVVVGGHTRNIGKTSVMEGILRALPEHEWVAMKITQYGHGICSANGQPCDCVTADHTLAVSEERNPASGTDTSRYLAAGAVRSYWVRTQQGMLAEAMPLVRAKIAAARHVLIESNSVLQFLRPDLYLALLDPANSDFKASALRFLDRADAVLVAKDGWQKAAGMERLAKDGWQKAAGMERLAKDGWQKAAGKGRLARSGWQGTVGGESAWDCVASSLLRRLRCIEVGPPHYVTEEVINMVRERMLVAVDLRLQPPA